MNNKTTKKSLILPVLTLAVGTLIGGCSSGGDPKEETSSLSGKVLGSLVEGAIVCIDENENGRCDSTDQHRIFSTADGSYQIADISPSLFEKPIVVEVPLTAMVVDPVNGNKSPVATEYRLVYPPSDADNRVVSSLSTLVNSEFLKQGNLADANQAVANKLSDAGIGVNANSLLDDYVTPATSSAASQDEISIYNVAKLAGNVMQVAQAGTAGNSDIDASALFSLVAQKVFDTIDQIEEIARNNQTLISQSSADQIVGDLATINDFDISSQDIQIAAQLDALPFDLGPINYVNVLNFKEGNTAAEWRKVTYARFKTPGGQGNLTLDEYREQIPQSYEIGVLDDQGNLLMTKGFHEPLWGDESDPKFWYAFDDEQFTVYTRAESGSWPVGDYEFVLCPNGCDSDRIHLGMATQAPYDTNIDVADFTELDNLVQNEMQFTTSDSAAFRDSDKQWVFATYPPPNPGTYYRIELGVDDDGDGLADSSRMFSDNRSLDGVEVPTDWIDSTHDFVANVAHRDVLGFENVSWEARTEYHSITLDRRRSFAVDEIFDVYMADYSTNNDFAEGIDSELYFYLGDGARLTGLRYEDANGNDLGTLCLPEDMPTAQVDIATYGVDHNGDGANIYFTGCQNTDLHDLFGLNGNVWTNVRLQGETSRKSDTEVLNVEVYLQQEDSNNTWGEPGDSIGSMRYVVARFADGSSQKLAIDLNKPNQNFSTSYNPDISVCSINSDQIRITWTPPEWMNSEFESGELSVNLAIRARDENDSEIARYRNRTRIGATSTVVPISLLQGLANNNETITTFSMRAAIGDMDYYDWKHRTYWTKIWRNFTSDNVLNASACN